MNINKHVPVQYLLANLNTRSSIPEIMDSLDCDSKMLLQTIHQFKYINKFLSGIFPLLQNTLIDHMKSLCRPNYTVIDLGSGGCDIPLWLLRISRQQSLHLKIYCIDNDMRTTEYALNKYRYNKNISILTGNALDILDKLEADYIIANHFLHHLSDQQIVLLLKKVCKQSKCGFIINDLLRSRTSLFFFFFFASIFFRKSFSLIDGLLSIARSFSRDDLQEYIKLAGIDAVINDVSPGHICLYSLI